MEAPWPVIPWGNGRLAGRALVFAIVPDVDHEPACGRHASITSLGSDRISYRLYDPLSRPT